MLNWLILVLVLPCKISLFCEKHQIKLVKINSGLCCPDSKNAFFLYFCTAFYNCLNSNTLDTVQNLGTKIIRPKTGCFFCTRAPLYRFLAGTKSKGLYRFVPMPTDLYRFVPRRFLLLKAMIFNPLQILYKGFCLPLVQRYKKN